MKVLPIKSYPVVVAYTDYPLLPEENDTDAKVREVDVLAFHPARGACVHWSGQAFWLPLSRLFKQPGRMGEVEAIAGEDLGGLPQDDPTL